MISKFRTSTSSRRSPGQVFVLVALGLVTISDHLPAITPKGRKALIRGSFRLLDAAA